MKSEADPEDKKVLSTFFKQHEVQIVKHNASEPAETVFDGIKNAIQTVFNPIVMAPESQESDHEILHRYLETVGQSPDEEEKENVEEKDKEEVKIEEAKAKSRLDKIKEQERELLDTRSQPIRQYLMDMVVPLLTEGLIQICKEMPENPTGQLADYLLKRCEEIELEQKNNPAPS